MGSKKRRNKGQQREGECAYCGYRGPITRDHAIPRALFIEMDPDMVTVAACERCQRIKGQGDRDLEIFVTLDIFGSHHPDNLAHAQKIVGRNEPTRQWLIRMLEAAKEIPLVTDEGIQLSTALSFDFNFDRIMIMMQMAIRGLYFHEYQEVLPRDIPIELVRVPWNMGLEILRTFGPFRDGPPIEKGNRVVFWKRMSVEGVSEDSTFWVICFNDAVVFLGATGPLAARLAEIRERAERRGKDQTSEIVTLPTSVLPDMKLPKDVNGNYMLPPILRDH